MAARFLIAVRNDEAADASSLNARIANAHLAQTLLSEGLLAWAAPADRPLVLPHASGVVFGNLFRRSDHGSVNGFEHSECKGLATDGMQHFIDHYWGGYVALVVNAGTGLISVLRDPSGVLPCFWGQKDGWILLASDIDLLTGVGAFETSVDWSSLATYLVGSGLPSARTCLKGINELLGGHVATFSKASVVVDPVWSPWEHAAIPMRQSDSELAESLRSTILGCVGAWGKCFSHPLIGVSGGLDSSIVAAALTANHIPYTAFTMYTHDTEGDERKFARTLATTLGVELLEFRHEHSQVDLSRSASAGGARPGVLGYGQSNLFNQMEITADRGIDAFFSGIGGDNVFCFLQSATPLVDRFQSEGLSPGLVTTLRDIGNQTGASLTDVLTDAMRSYSTAKQAYVWPIDNRFLTPTASERIEARLHHEWLRSPGQMPKGKAVHIARMIIMQMHSEVFPRGRFGPQVFPLLAQPIVELCLAIPTWKWCAGGMNRAVARNAFADLLPASIITRRSKGGPDNFACEVVERNKSQIRELLLDGCLAQNALIDREALGECLSDMRVIHGRDHARVATLCEAEAWARSWSKPGTSI